MPAVVADSNRRILWIVAMYRSVCGAVLLGIALLADLQTLAVAAPNTFVTAAGLYFLFVVRALYRQSVRDWNREMVDADHSLATVG